MYVETDVDLVEAVKAGAKGACVAALVWLAVAGFVVVVDTIAKERADQAVDRVQHLMRIYCVPAAVP